MVLTSDTVRDRPVCVGNNNHVWVLLLESSQTPCNEPAFDAVLGDIIGDPQSVKFEYVLGSSPQPIHLFVVFSNEAALRRPTHEFADGQNPNKFPVGVFYAPRPRDRASAMEVVMLDDECRRRPRIDS